MYCKNCGKQIRDDSAFCEHCGTKQGIRQPEQQAVQQIPTQQPMMVQPSMGTGKGWKIAMFYAIGAAIIAFGIFAYVQWFSPKSDAAAVVENTASFEDIVPGGSQLSLGDTGAAYEAQTAQPDVTSTADVQSVEQSTDTNVSVLGAWEGQQDSSYIGFEFFSDGTMRYVKDKSEEYYYYKIKNDMIIFTDETDEQLELVFTINTQDGTTHLTLGYGENAYELVRTDSLAE